MTISFKQAFGGGGGGASQGGYTRLFPVSGTHTFNQNGTIVLTVLMAGGGGSMNGGSGVGSCLGGNSGSWGRVVLPVSATDVLTVSLGAGGLGKTAPAGSGLQGGTTTISLNGTSIITGVGAAGGVYKATGDAVPAAITGITGLDFVVDGLKAGLAPGDTGFASGGASVDVLRTGLGRSPTGTSGPAVGGSVGTNLGGNVLPNVVFFDFGFTTGDGVTAGTPGKGAITTAIAGPFGGGSYVTPGGYGGGGGGNGIGSKGSDGGSALAVFTFTPES